MFFILYEKITRFELQVKMIYHIIPATTWLRIKNQDEYKMGSLDTEGFIHCCTEHQIEGVIDRYFNSEKELIVLHIDPERLKDILKYEQSTGSEFFPHVYGCIPAKAVVSVEMIIQ